MLLNSLDKYYFYWPCNFLFLIIPLFSPHSPHQIIVPGLFTHLMQWVLLWIKSEFPKPKYILEGRRLLGLKAVALGMCCKVTTPRAPPGCVWKGTGAPAMSALLEDMSIWIHIFWRFFKKYRLDFLVLTYLVRYISWIHQNHIRTFTVIYKEKKKEYILKIWYHCR